MTKTLTKRQAIAEARRMIQAGNLPDIITNEHEIFYDGGYRMTYDYIVITNVDAGNGEPLANAYSIRDLHTGCLYSPGKATS